MTHPKQKVQIGAENAFNIREFSFSLFAHATHQRNEVEHVQIIIGFFSTHFSFCLFPDHPNKTIAQLHLNTLWAFYFNFK